MNVSGWSRREFDLENNGGYLAIDRHGQRDGATSTRRLVTSGALLVWERRATAKLASAAVRDREGFAGQETKPNFLFVGVYHSRLDLGPPLALITYSFFIDIFLAYRFLRQKYPERNAQLETWDLLSASSRDTRRDPSLTSTMADTRLVPSAFEARKSKILADLSIPDAEYTDLSPKGSVDEGIRDLIQDINGLPGLVTTSSCAGRISVFLEGRKKQPQRASEEQRRQFAPSGGKGAGKWLYVSHDPLEEKAMSLHERFGLTPGDGKPPAANKAGQAPRLVRFHYEPMVC